MASVVLMPKIGISVESCVIGSWRKRVGDGVKTGDILFDYETDKASLECESTADGILLEILAGDGTEASVLEPVCVIGKTGEDISPFIKKEAAGEKEKSGGPREVVETSSPPERDGLRASPRAKNLADRVGVNLADATPTGPDGRIIARDIDACIAGGKGVPRMDKNLRDERRVPAGVETGGQSGGFTDERMSLIRRTIADAMTASLRDSAQLTNHHSFDASRILALRSEFKENGDALRLDGISIGDMILYAVAKTLPDYPYMNAHVIGDTLRKFSDVHLGVAVDTPRGLMVPTIFNADKKSLAAISRETKELASACRKGDISPELLHGATFTVSNLGATGPAASRRIRRSACPSLTITGRSTALRRPGFCRLSAPGWNSSTCCWRCDLAEVWEMEKFDLLIIGGGPAGYTAAERASAGGMKVGVFERKSLGGVCLNEGCIPTKTMMYSAKILDGALRGSPYGVNAAGALDHASVMKRKAKVVKTLVAGIAAKMKHGAVSVVKGNAVVKGMTKNGFFVSCGEDYEASNLLIAAGSEPVVPPIEGIEESLASKFAVTSEGALELNEIPKELVIIGGGAIGLELACYYGIAGSHVTVVEMLDRIGGRIDAEISGILCGSLKKRGIEFRLGQKVTGLAPGECVKIGKDRIIADKVILSIGRKPAISGFGLESIGVWTDRGAIVTDERLRTNVPKVYAAGDVNGKVMLAHTAQREAEVAVNDMFGRRDVMSYNSIPSVIYTIPEVACVGETEESAAEKGLEIRTVRLSMRYAGRYVAENDGGDGICKAVFGRDNRLLGAHMIGGSASEIILSAHMMIESRLPVENLKKIIFPHPTTGEILREAFFNLTGGDTNAQGHNDRS
jgi:dihydrolipoamide dehydrogenase